MTARPVAIRPRTDADLPSCERIARAVHALDGYPPYLPDGDFRRLLVSADALATFVATGDDGVDVDVLGHVALHRRTAPATMALATRALRLAEADVGVVARLFVDPAARRRGVARSLLDHAAAAARARGLRPILDVWTELGAAVAVYDRAGWQRLGTAELRFPDATRFDVFVYAAPDTI